MTVDLDFTLEPAEAMAFFRGKGLRPSYAWHDMLHEEHDAAFTVAKMLDVDLLSDVRESLERAIGEGRTLHQWRQELEPELVRRGWWGRAEMANPRTGEVELVQLGSPRRLRTIFQTNLRTSYAAGEWARIEEVAESRPYLMYDTAGDDKVRDEHEALDGMILRVYDPAWERYYPPNDWECRCGVIQLDEFQMRRMGRSAPDAGPPAGAGVGEGWDYHPGRDRLPALRDALAAVARTASAELGAPARDLVRERTEPSAALASALTILRERPLQADAAARIEALRSTAPAHEQGLFAALLAALREAQR